VIISLLMKETLSLEVKKTRDLSGTEQAEVLALCDAAYKQDYVTFMKTFPNSTHVLGRIKGKLVSHALWVTRWLQNGDTEPWRTAYVEAVATDEHYRRRGYVSAVMRCLGEEIQDYDIGGLCTGRSVHLYAATGWQLWRGPLFIRMRDGSLLPTPDEHGVMVLPLPKTPPLDLDSPLSAEWREGELW
jgi:aminoglycoside 2'-N-acetyltransferase I